MFLNTNANSSELAEAFTLRKTVASMAPLVRGKDKPRLEQLLSADCATGILITTLADGTRLNDMKDWELFKISRQHLVDLQATIDTMKGIGLHPHNVGGVFFDEKIGFNFVDYEIDDNEPNGMLNNLNIANLEDFVYGALADWNRLQQYVILRDLKLKSSAEDFKTTGLRALARAVIMRKAAKLTQT